MGEAARQQQLEAEHTKLREQAAAKAEAIDQHAMGVAVGKGGSKGDNWEMFSAWATPARYSPLAGKAGREGEAITNMLKASTSLSAAQADRSIDDACPTFGPRPAPTSPADAACGSPLALPTQWFSS